MFKYRQSFKYILSTVDCKFSYKRTVTNHDVELQTELDIRNVNFERILIEFLSKIDEEPNKKTNIFRESFGFIPIIKQSNIINAGLGVYLDGKTTKNQIVGIYPGLIYEQEDPALWCSYKNDYFLRRCDGSSVDGKYYGLSGWLYKSIAKKNAIFGENGKIDVCDTNWIEIAQLGRRNSNLLALPTLINPLNSGQLINCASDGKRANVMYYEYDFTFDFPLHLRKYIPNISYNSNQMEDLLVKSILMISLRDIENEELLSDYSFIGSKLIT